MPLRSTPSRCIITHEMIAGSLASIASTWMIVRRSQRDSGDCFCGTNATSHWLWGERALHQHGASARYTALGYLIHHICAMFWGCIYVSWLQGTGDRRVAPRGGEIGTKAMTVAALAATVDYTATPQRLTPGFERHLSLRSMGWVYLSFGAALAASTLFLTKR